MAYRKPIDFLLQVMPYFMPPYLKNKQKKIMFSVEIEARIAPKGIKKICFSY